MSFSSLPIELLYEILEHLHVKKDLSALVRTSYRFYQTLNTCLYQFDRKYCGSSALSWAATQGETRTAQMPLAERASAQTKDDCLQAAVQLAVESGSCEVVALLSDNGVDLNASVDYFGNLLQVACWLGNEEMMSQRQCPGRTLWECASSSFMGR